MTTMTAMTTRTTPRERWQKGVRTLRLIARARRRLAHVRRRPDRRGSRACLVTNLSRMGDVVMSAGIVATLRERLPDSPLFFLCQPEWTELLEGDPVVDGVLGARTFFELRALGRSRLFDTLYVLDIPIPDLIHYLEGVPGVFRYGPPTTADWFRQGRHLVALYEANAGLPEGSTSSRVWLSAADRELAAELWARYGLAAGAEAAPVVALHTASSRGSKTWSEEHFAALVRQWTRTGAARFVIVGGPGEAHSLAGMPGVTHLAGRLGVRQTAAVLERCDFFIGLDSGLSYVAEAANTPGLVLLGATCAGTSGPRGSGFTYLRSPAACEPACHTGCPCRPRCIDLLTVSEVSDALARGLRLRRPAGRPDRRNDVS